MSNNYWDEDEDELDTTTDATSGDGSDLLKKLRKAKRADEKRIRQLTEQLEQISEGHRERTVKEILENQGLNPKIARLALKDLDDVSEESIKNWLTENEDIFGQTASTETQENNEDRAALRRQDLSTQSAMSPERGRDLEMRIANAKSEDELRAILNSQ